MSKFTVLQRQALRREAEARQQQPQPQPQQPQQPPTDTFSALIAAVAAQALRQHAQPGGQHDVVLGELRALREEVADLKAQLTTRPAATGHGYTFAVERDLNGRMTRVHARPATGKPS